MYFYNIKVCDNYKGYDEEEYIYCPAREDDSQAGRSSEEAYVEGSF